MKWLWVILLVICALVVLVARTLPPIPTRTKSAVSPSAKVIKDLILDCRQECESRLYIADDGRMIMSCICPDSGSE